MCGGEGKDPHPGLSDGHSGAVLGPRKPSTAVQTGWHPPHETWPVPMGTPCGGQVAARPHRLGGMVSGESLVLYSVAGVGGVLAPSAAPTRASHPQACRPSAWAQLSPRC